MEQLNSTKITDEQLAEITRRVTENYNNNNGIQIVQSEPGTLKVTNNAIPKKFTDKELEVIRLFIDSIQVSYEAVINTKSNEE